MLYEIINSLYHLDIMDNLEMYPSHTFTKYYTIFVWTYLYVYMRKRKRRGGEGLPHPKLEMNAVFGQNVNRRCYQVRAFSF